MNRSLVGFVLSAVVSTAACSCAGEGRLRSPWDMKKVALTDALYACPEAPHLSPDLTTSGFYSDSKGSIIDPLKWKAYGESAGPYKKLGDLTSAAADAYQTTGSKQAAACVLRLEKAAALDRVLTGKMSSSQA